MATLEAVLDDGLVAESKLLWPRSVSRAGTVRKLTGHNNASVRKPSSPAVETVTAIVAAKHAAKVIASKRFADDPLRSKKLIIAELKRWWTAVCAEINTDGGHHHTG